MNWQLQDAKNKLSQVIDKCIKEGPQVITRRGQEAVVLVPINDYKQMTKNKCDLVDFFRKSPLAGNVTIKRNSDTTVRRVNL